MQDESSDFLSSGCGRNHGSGHRPPCFAATICRRSVRIHPSRLPRRGPAPAGVAPDGHTQIWAVDISFRPETTRRLQCAFGPDFVWIDHHISALEAWRDTGWEHPTGIRDTAHSAAWLTWHHLFAAPAPFAVTWADKYDLWQQDAEWETRTCPWQMVVTCRFSTPERYDLRVFSDERLHETYLRRYGRPMFAYEQQLRRRETGAVQPVILSFDGRRSPSSGDQHRRVSRRATHSAPALEAVALHRQRIRYQCCPNRTAVRRGRTRLRGRIHTLTYRFRKTH